MADEMNITAVEVSTEEDALQVVLDVRNSSSRTMYCYRSPRGYRYDPAAKTLQIWMTDRRRVEGPIHGIEPTPDLTPIDPGQTHRLEVRPPRFLTRLSETADSRGRPVLEQLPIHQAEEVEVELGFGETPFYPQPPETKKSVLQQIREWEADVIVGRGRRGEAVQTAPPTKQAKTARKKAAKKRIRKRSAKKKGS